MENTSDKRSMSISMEELAEDKDTAEVNQTPAPGDGGEGAGASAPEEEDGEKKLANILANAKQQNLEDLSLEALIKRAFCKSEEVSEENLAALVCPPQLCDLASLTKLNLSHNSLPSLPPLFGLLGALTDLDLSRNRLSALPSSFSRLENLRALDLSFNVFVSVPEECFSHLTNLVSLNAGGNQIETMPSDLGCLNKLATLRLEGNGLKSLPAEIGELKDLEVLDLSANQLSELPETLVKLVGLNELYLLGNPLRVAPPENSNFSTHKSAIHSYLTFAYGGMSFSADPTQTRDFLHKQFPGVEVEVISSVLENCASGSQALDFLLSMNAPSSPQTPHQPSPRKSLHSSLSQLPPVTGLRKMIENLTKPTTPGSKTTDDILPPPTNKFLRYENENNRLFKALISDPDFHDILAILLEKEMTLLVPQDIVLDGVEIDRALLLGHTISWDTEDGATENRPFTTNNGVHGQFSEAAQTLRLDLPSTQEGDCWEAAVLRQGEFTIDGTQSPIPIYLISAPLGPTTPSITSDSLDTPLADSLLSPLPKDGKESDGSKVPQHLLPPSTPGGKDIFDLQLARPLIIDPFMTKLHSKPARNLRMSIEQFVRSVQKKGQILEDQRDFIFRFLESAKLQMAALPPWKGIPKSEVTFSEDALDAVVFTKIYKSIFYTTSDQERDMMLSSKMKRLQFVTPDMLGIPPQFCNRKMWAIAERELLMMNSHCAPKEKLRALINCCKVIIQLLNGAENVAGADDFLPHLCIVVLRAYPPHLHSNVRYVARYVGSHVLVSETLYYYTQVVSVISFIENIEPHHLNLSPAQYERYMEGHHGAESSDIPPVPDHSTLPNAGAQKSSILSLAVPLFPPSPQRTRKPTPTISANPKQYDRFLECTSVEDLRVGELQALLSAFKDLAKRHSSEKPSEGSTPTDGQEGAAADTHSDTSHGGEKDSPAPQHEQH